MYVQLNCVIVDADAANRQELADFLGAVRGARRRRSSRPSTRCPALLGAADAPQLVIVNLDPDAHETLKKIGHLPRQFPNDQLLPDEPGARRQPADGGDAPGREGIHPAADERGEVRRRHRARRAEPRHGQAGQGHPRDPDDRRVRVDHRRLQRRRVAGQDGQDGAAGPGSGPRRRRQLLRHPPALHDRRRDGLGREGGQAAAGQRAGDPPEQRPGDPGPAGTAGGHAAREPAGLRAAAGHARPDVRLRRDRLGDEHRPDLRRRDRRRRT